MRTAIIAFTGIALGVVLAMSSPYVSTARDQHTNQFYKYFDRPAIMSIGKIKVIDANYVTISFGDALTHRKILFTPYTKVTADIHKKIDARTLVKHQLKELIDTVVLMKYIEIPNGLLLIEITALTPLL